LNVYTLAAKNFMLRIYEYFNNHFTDSGECKMNDFLKLILTQRKNKRNAKNEKLEGTADT